MNINDQLFIAAQIGDLDSAIKFLTQDDVDVDSVHAVGATPLYIAAQNGHSQMVELLLKHGADPESAFSNGLTPLCVAANNGHAEAAQVLLNYGADIEAHIGTTTAIHLAAQNGQRAVVRLLLENGASLENGAKVATKEQNMLEILLQQGDHRIKKIGCSDSLSKEIFAEEGINYEVVNQALVKDGVYKINHIKDYINGEQKIPLITHQIYFTSLETPKEIDALSLNKTIVSSQRLNHANSNWKHIIWTNNFQIIPKSLTSVKNVEVRLIDELQGSILYQELIEMLQLSKSDGAMFSRASDLLRTMVVEKFGGIYYDLDYEIYRPEKLLELTKAFDFLGGKEVPNEPSAIGSAFIAAIPGHPILKNALTLLKRNLDKESNLPNYVQYPCTKWHKTWFETNPIVTTMAALQSANNGTIDVIMPSNVLYNVDYARSHAPGSRCYDPKKIVNHLDENTIGADMFCGSWSANENFLNFFYYPENVDAYLYEAALHGYTRIVQYFHAEKGANINALSEMGATPLHIATENGHVGTAKYLLESGALTEIKASNHLTALAIAVQNKHPEIVKLLVNHGADIESKYPSGATPLYVAAFFGDKAMVEILINAGANKNIIVNGLDAAQMAAKAGFAEVAQMLATRNYVVTDLNNQLLNAVQVGDAILAEQLIEKGANVNAAYKINDVNITLLCIAAYEGNNELVKLLLAKGAKIDATLDDNSTALYGATFKGRINVVETLLKAGANTEIAVIGHTPLYAAIFNNRLDLAKLILSYGAEVQSDERFTPLYLTEIVENKEAYQFLVDNYLSRLKNSSTSMISTAGKNKIFEAVIVRYKEAEEYLTRWTAKEFPNDELTVYNKGSHFINIPYNWNVKNIPNIGYFGGTILYHIVNNYENLANKTLFLQADPYASPVFLPLARYKGELNSTCNNIIAKCSSTTLVEMSRFLENFDWKNDKHGRYKNFEPLNYTIIEFTHKYISANYLPTTTINVCDGAEFAIESSKILLHDKSVYEKMLLEAFNITLPKADHYLEKLWDLLFQKAPPVYNLDVLNNQLFNAALNGQTTLVDLLLKAGANQNFSVNDKSILYAAIFNGHKETIELLLKNGANIADNDNHFTPMFIAATKGLSKRANQHDKDIYNLVLDYYWKDVEKFHQNNQVLNKNAQVVVARFNEDVSWIQKEYPNTAVTIYNKGDDIIDPLPNWNIVKVPNVGQDPFAFVSYIVDYYDNLSDFDIIIFLQGTPYDHPVFLPLGVYQTDVAHNCENIIGKCQNTTIKVEWDAISHTLETKGWETYDNGKYSNVVMGKYTYLQYNDEFICKYPLETKFKINWGTEFAVPTENIKRHPIEYYKALLEPLSTPVFTKTGGFAVPIEVHYFERNADLIFAECPYQEVEMTGEVTAI